MALAAPSRSTQLGSRAVPNPYKYIRHCVGAEGTSPVKIHETCLSLRAEEVDQIRGIYACYLKDSLIHSFTPWTTLRTRRDVNDGGQHDSTLWASSLAGEGCIQVTSRKGVSVRSP